MGNKVLNPYSPFLIPSTHYQSAVIPIPSQHRQYVAAHCQFAIRDPRSAIPPLLRCQFARLWRQFFIAPVNVVMESDGTIFFDPGREVEEVDGQRPFELDPAL